MSLTKYEVFSKSFVDHYSVWRWDLILLCWRYIYIYIRHDIRCHKMFGADTHVCPYYEVLILENLWNMCVPVLSHHWKGSFISHVVVEVPVTDVDKVDSRRDTASGVNDVTERS